MALPRHSRKYALTEEQRHMYASEKLMNFRWISKILASYSPHTLTSHDFAPTEVQSYLSEIGQFAEVAYSTISTEFIFENLTLLLEPSFPLEGYESFRDAKLVSSFIGKVAQLPGYVAYRSHTKQLIVAFSGTVTAMQAFYDVRALKHRHPSHRGRVHHGFWKLYKGIKAFALDGVRKGLAEHEVTEFVITGHSMGATVSQLFLLDILRDENLVSIGSIPLKLVVFGAPRSGTKSLVKYWRELLVEHRTKYGKESVCEYSVKTYNDGVPSLPPLSFGYRHYAESPLYFVHGRLYQVPPESSEYALYHVSPDLEDENDPPEHPRGGHNYYNGRDMEKFARRAIWLDKAMKMDGDWQEHYRHLSSKERTPKFKTPPIVAFCMPKSMLA
ncbi:Alpha/Beta hydrolase protein [Mycena maculata]|uniref:Alpha/Beta hydrolase protein n=1 Tax=Mycena maculata TaxID=230809 RepID=A0AAD7IFJ3_9AGAR|nr:Alpha/Beta hydrolase protein [Mycena maculata]